MTSVVTLEALSSADPLPGVCQNDIGSGIGGTGVSIDLNPFAAETTVNNLILLLLFLWHDTT